MLKKAFSVLAVTAFVLGAIPQTNMAKTLADACSYVCCDHNGDIWDN